MSPKFYKATCTKEISWPEKNGRTYRQDDTIIVSADDIQILSEAGVIGDIRKMVAEVETAVIEAPENAARSYRTQKRGRN